MTGIERLIGTIAAIVLAVMMFITFGDVVGRQLFGRPIDGATEITEISLMLIVFLMLPLVALRSKNIRVDLLDHVLGKGLMLMSSTFGNALGAILFGLMSYRLSIVAKRSIGYGDITPELEISVGHLFWIMSALSAFTALGFVAALVIGLFGKTSTDIEEHGL